MAFTLRRLGSTEKNYSQLYKEGWSIVYGVSNFHKYIAGQQVTVITDHQPLIGIMGEKKQVQSVPSPRMTLWCLKIATYDCKWV